MYERGKVFKRDKKLIYITGGCYLDPVYGRVSNWWYWKEVKKDGSLGRLGQGYGESGAQPIDCKITMTPKIKLTKSSK